jgi:peptidoglycan/LPS O-acetylase OafA/YrhL
VWIPLGYLVFIVSDLPNAWIIGVAPYLAIGWMACLYTARGQDEPSWLPRALAAGWFIAGATLIFMLVTSDRSDPSTWVMVVFVLAVSLWPALRLIRERSSST